MKADRVTTKLREAYPLPADLERLRSLATFDLWHGPMPDGFWDDDGEPWPGFVTACERLSAWADDVLPRTVWYDDDCESILESEPEAWLDDETGEWIEPILDSIYVFHARDIRAAIFPMKLSEYL